MHIDSEVMLLTVFNRAYSQVNVHVIAPPVSG